MIKASIDLQDLRRRLYVKAKAEPSWRFWGLYVHVCKMETLRQAYALAKANNGAPGSDGVTFAAIEAQGVEIFLKQIQYDLIERVYKPLPARRQEIPKDGGKVRVLMKRSTGWPRPSFSKRRASLTLICVPTSTTSGTTGCY
jgi:RNA-directed DNA polymerase